MVDSAFTITIDEIVALLRQADYDPYAQISGYLQTGDETYITRTGNARTKIAQLDKELPKEYLYSIK